MAGKGRKMGKGGDWEGRGVRKGFGRGKRKLEGKGRRMEGWRREGRRVGWAREGRR